MNSEKEEEKLEGIPKAENEYHTYLYQDASAVVQEVLSPVDNTVANKDILPDGDTPIGIVNTNIVKDENVILPVLEEIIETPIIDIKPESRKSKISGILVILLFIFLFAFVIFLPNITTYLQLQKDKPIFTPAPTASPTPIPTPVQGLNITLDMIAKEFQTNEDVISIRSSAGNSLTAIVNNKEITVKYQNKDVIITSHYKVEDSVLITTDADMTTAPIMVEVISKLQGNEKDASDIIFEKDFSTYVLGADGIELKQEGTLMSMKIDLTKKMNLLDKTKVVIELSDLESNQDNFNSDTDYYLSKGNFYLIKNKIESGYIIYLGEKIDFTENTYKSLLSIVEFYAKKELDSFRIAYPKLDNLEKQVGSIVISYDISESVKESFERLGTYKIVKIEIKR